MAERYLLAVSAASENVVGGNTVILAGLCKKDQTGLANAFLVVREQRLGYTQGRSCLTLAYALFAAQAGQYFVEPFSQRTHLLFRK